MGRRRGEKWWKSEQGLKGKEGGKMRENRFEERGARKHTRKTLILVPLFCDEARLTAPMPWTENLRIIRRMMFKV